MKRTTKNQRHRWLQVMGMVILLAYACNRHDLLPYTERTDDQGELNLKVDKAQRWYNTVEQPVFEFKTGPEASVKQQRASGQGIKNKKGILAMPNWERAKERKKGRYAIVEMPIKTKGKVLFLDAETKERMNRESDRKAIRNSARLIIQKDLETGEMRSFISVFLGTYDYLKGKDRIHKNSYFKRDKDFEGDVNFYNLDGSLINGWRYRKGKIVARITPADEPVMTTFSSTTGGANSCSTVPVWVEVEDCEQDSYLEWDEEWGEDVVNVDVDCEPKWEVQYQEVCDDAPETPDEPTGPPGNGSGSGSNPGYVDPTPSNPPTGPQRPTTQQIKNQIKNDPFALFGDLDCDIVQDWLATAKHQVQQAQIDKLNSIRMSTTQVPWAKTEVIAKVQAIDNAYSTVVNMDYFPVTISQLPVVNGNRLTPSQFIEYIRKNINNFVDTDKSEFTPYNYLGINDNSLWQSNNPLNAVVGIDIPGLLGPNDQIFDDDGAVIVSKHSNTGWTFTTIFDPIYGNHPVSGNRDFGYTQNANGTYTFYTRGVDRLTYAFGTALQEVFGKPFGDADDLWISFQNGVKNFVNNHGGNSQLQSPVIERPNWQKIKDVIDGKLPLSTLSSDCDD